MFHASRVQRRRCRARQDTAFQYAPCPCPPATGNARITVCRWPALPPHRREHTLRHPAPPHVPKASRAARRARVCAGREPDSDSRASESSPDAKADPSGGARAEGVEGSRAAVRPRVFAAGPSRAIRVEAGYREADGGPTSSARVNARPPGRWAGGPVLVAAVGDERLPG